MAKEKQQVEQITDMEVDFAQWYTDVVKKAELIEYAGVKGFYVVRPYAYAIWENIQKIMDGMFKELGHENVSMPLLIPESLLQKEKDHVEGFAPEVAWVTHGGSEELTERLCIRPTSETLFCDHYSRIVRSWRDLPKLYNQWCTVLRWEKATRPFLRHREFLWQEGHTVHATEDEARAETMQMLEVYADTCENWLAMPVIRGRKTEKEKFAGAVETYSIECMMHDTRALQAGTSHYFGDGFARAFDITFTDKDNTIQYCHQTSWGASTRLIGGIIMTHGDNNGLILPPKVAPIQVAIVPIATHKPGVMERAAELLDRLKAAGIRVKLDESDQSPGWKFAEYEMKGVPLRLEMGPRDLEQNQCVLVRRDNGEKVVISQDDLESQAAAALEAVQQGLYEKAKKHLDAHTFTAQTLEEAKTLIATDGGFVKAMWCGERACEEQIKDTTSITSRNIPFDQERISETCFACGKPAEMMVIWGMAY